MSDAVAAVPGSITVSDFIRAVENECLLYDADTLGGVGLCSFRGSTGRCIYCASPGKWERKHVLYTDAVNDVANRGGFRLRKYFRVLCVFSKPRQPLESSRESRADVALTEWANRAMPLPSSHCVLGSFLPATLLRSLDMDTGSATG